MKCAAIFPILVVAVGAQVTCSGGPLTAAARGEIVAQHNRLRSSVARGNSSPGPTGGQNIYALSYNCTLESQAQAQASRCEARRSPLSSRPDAGENIFQYRGNARAPGAIAFSAIQWWNQIFRGWTAAADNVYTQAVHDTGIDMYAQMAWGDTTLVGCGYAECSGFKSVVCNYRTGGPKIGQVMVQPGVACSANSACTTFPRSTCNSNLGLCVAPPGTDPIPLTTTTSSVTTTQLTTTTTPSPLASCTAAPLMNEAARIQVLTRLNGVRSLIARSQDVNGQFKRGSQSMFALKYSCDLEATAQTTANLCPAAAADPGVGQSNAYDAAAPADASTLVDLAETAWVGQINVFDPAVDFTTGVNTLAAVGNIVQVLQAAAKTVGCGYATCPPGPRAVFVCNFDPPFPHAAGMPYTPETSDGCRRRRCEVGNPTATCNRTTGLCELP